MLKNWFVGNNTRCNDIPMWATLDAWTAAVLAKLAKTIVTYIFLFIPNNVEQHSLYIFVEPYLRDFLGHNIQKDKLSVQQHIF